MNAIQTIDKLTDLTVGQSSWKVQAQKRKKENAWLSKSRAIAFIVLDTLKMKGMTQVQLAELLEVTPQQVNKIVKGRENLTLETISKLEDALGVSFFVFQSTFDYKETDSSFPTKIVG